MYPSDAKPFSKGCYALLKSVGTVWTPDRKEMVVFVTG